MNFSLIRRRATWLATALLVCHLPAQALSSHEIADAIAKAQILTSPISVQIEGSSVTVSTYLNRQATNKDFKVDAALIAKAVIDLAPTDIARVTVYYYNTTMTKCDAVSVTAGDVKSFSSGAMSKEQLLSTLILTPVKVSDTNNKVAAYLDSGKQVRSGRPLKTRVNGSVLELTAEAEPWASERDLKLEALQLAEKVSEVSSPSIRKIRVEFVAVNNPKKLKQITIDMHTLTTIHNGIETLLQPLAIAEINNDGSFPSVSGRLSSMESIDVQTLDVLPGPAREDRSKLLTRMQALGKLGVGMDPFLDSFLRIEESAKNGEEVTEAVTKLSAQLDEQEKLHKSAQEFVPIKKGGTKAATPAPTKSSLPSSAWDPDSSTAAPPDIVRNILQDHLSWMSYYEKRWHHDGHSPEDYPNYVKLLDLFGRTLRGANRIPEAEIYENKAKEIRAKKKDDSKQPAKDSAKDKSSH
ncbi:MAG: hypothetical protein HYX67_06300 [Candidatus Melainabacteria bacterium]|nr:hypothetical protein [Candidatus Melainabacteria bacterium]